MFLSLFEGMAEPKLVLELWNGRAGNKKITKFKRPRSRAGASAKTRKYKSSKAKKHGHANIKTKKSKPK